MLNTFRYILFFFLFGLSLSGTAQIPGVGESDYISRMSPYKLKEVKELIGIDTSVADFDIKFSEGKKSKSVDLKPDVIGSRLAKIVGYILTHSNEDIINRPLSSYIQRDEELFYVDIEKLNLTRIQKNDSIITVSFDAKLSKNSLKLTSSSIELDFVDGVPTDELLSGMIQEFVRYFKEQ